MECNKDEAIRAKEIAEERMQSGDFLGAHKIALKAQRLFPALENISQLLTVCEVHCAAKKRVSASEMDWYAILQVEFEVDQVTIKKQYRKLALLLHPDKNKFAGAEAAFKLIGEANRVLSDPGKRVSYDVMYRASLKIAAQKPLHRQSNVKFSSMRQHGAGNNTQRPPPSESKSTQFSQQRQQQTFWTACPSCGVRYQYYMFCANRTLRCQSCDLPFVAYDLATNGMPPGSQQGSYPDQKEFFKKGTSKLASQNMEGDSSITGIEDQFAGLKTEVKEAGTASVSTGTKPRDSHVARGGVGMPNSMPGGSGTSTKSSNKRVRNSVSESSEGFNTESDTGREEDGVAQVNTSNFSEDSGRSGSHLPRRSSQLKQDISYKTKLNEETDDFVSTSKRPRQSSSFSASEEKLKTTDMKRNMSDDYAAGSTGTMDGPNKEFKDKARFSSEAILQNKQRKTEKRNMNDDDAASFRGTMDGPNKEFKDKASFSSEGSLQNQQCKTENHLPKVKTEAASIFEQNCKKSDVDDSELKSNGAVAPQFITYSEPEFTDFDKERAEDCFSVDQIWAIYDPVDGMPRFYARVRKVFSPGFKLRITWLEPDPDNRHEIDWLNVDLPIASGKFKLGGSEETTDRLMFSQQMHFIKGSGRGIYFIYPRKGETWALFKNWDIGWNTDPGNYIPFKFEYVEILSDFRKDVGVAVAYLGKVEGFLTLFQRTKQQRMDSFQIPASELLRFSHQIPSCRMTGGEGEGIPVGSFEFDPAALPANFNEFNEKDDMKMETGKIDATVHNSCSNPSERRMNSSKGTERIDTPKKSEVNDFEKETLELRRSPRNFNGSSSTEGQFTSSEHKCKSLTDNRRTSKGDPIQTDKNATPKHRGAGGCKMSLNASSSPLSSSCKMPYPDAYDFNGNKTAEKFEVDQIWALYADKDGLPKKYVQVKKTETTADFKVHVVLLEFCPKPRGIANSVCCGMFKPNNGKTLVLTPASFSHQVTANPKGRNIYEILPRKGEVWAVYKNWSSASQHTGLDKGDYDVVEVLEDTGQSFKVVILIRVHGLKCIFRAMRIQRSKTGYLDLPRTEMARFSHQIPAIWHTGNKDIRLKDSWELDPSSVPGLVICLD